MSLGFPICADDEAERFWSKVDRRSPDECWEWTAGRYSKGYGAFCSSTQRSHKAHRFAWELANGRKIPGGLFVLHSCDKPSCCNPAHLRLGTNTDNMRDMATRGRGAKRLWTHCPRGHEFTAENIYWWRGRRHCIECRRLRDKIRRSRASDTIDVLCDLLFESLFHLRNDAAAEDYHQRALDELAKVRGDA